MWIVILVAALSSATLADCDSEAGRKVFNKCSACHSVEPGVHLMGPSLYDIMGQEAGSIKGFAYSPALAEATFSWDTDTLSAFLENPMQNLPGTTMPFAGLRKAKQRAAIACYLRAVAGSR